MKTQHVTVWMVVCFSTLYFTNHVGGAIFFVHPNGDSIDRVNLDGSNLETLFVGTSGARDVVVDNINGKMYWTSLSQNIIQGSNIDGSAFETVFSDVGLRTASIEIDVANQTLYWTTGSSVGGATELMRGNTNGTGLQTLVSGIDKTAMDLELDLSNGKVYYTIPVEKKINRVNLDGSNVETLVSGWTDAPSLWGIALDIDNNRMYWADGYLHEIRYSDLDGGNINTLFDTEVNDTIDLEFDAVNGGLYWSDVASNRIERYLNGTREIVLSDVRPYGFDIANLTPVPQPICNFDGDDGCDLFDVNLLLSQGDLLVGVALSPLNERFNTNEDNTIDHEDLSDWLENAALVNEFLSPYHRGDTNLDRDVDITDFNRLAKHFEPNGLDVFAENWHHGNFDGDGDIDITDFNFLAANFAPDGYGASAVPESSSLLLTLLGLMLLAGARVQ